MQKTEFINDININACTNYINFLIIQINKKRNIIKSATWHICRPPPDSICEANENLTTAQIYHLRNSFYSTFHKLIYRRNIFILWSRVSTSRAFEQTKFSTYWRDFLISLPMSAVISLSIEVLDIMLSRSNSFWSSIKFCVCSE